MAPEHGVGLNCSTQDPPGISPAKTGSTFSLQADSTAATAISIVSASPRASGSHRPTASPRRPCRRQPRPLPVARPGWPGSDARTTAGQSGKASREMEASPQRPAAWPGSSRPVRRWQAAKPNERNPHSDRNPARGSGENNKAPCSKGHTCPAGLARDGQPYRRSQKTSASPARPSPKSGTLISCPSASYSTTGHRP